jgi:hypothetical protein
MSTKRWFHSSGSIAATVSVPRGGKPARFEMNFRACLKLQKVSGYVGKTWRIFIAGWGVVEVPVWSQYASNAFQNPPGSQTKERE